MDKSVWYIHTKEYDLATQINEVDLYISIKVVQKHDVDYKCGDDGSDGAMYF